MCAEFFRQVDVKATRKPHKCDGCGTEIATGSQAYYYSQKYEGDFFTGYQHHDCRKAEVELNDLHGTYADEWDQLSIVHEEPEDADWLINNHPSVAARLGLLPTGED